MIKLIYCITKKPHLAAEEFYSHRSSVGFAATEPLANELP